MQEPPEGSTGSQHAHILTGVPASGGLAVGAVVRIAAPDVVGGSADGPQVSRDEAHTLLARQQQALVQRLVDRAARASSEDEQGIFTAHAALARDAELLSLADEAVRDGLDPASAARRAGGQLSQRLREADSERFRERAADVKDVVAQWVALIEGRDPDGGVVELPEHAVVVAHDLPPSVTAGLDRTRIAAFVLAAGGPTAHTAILARGYGIPAVVRVGDGVDHLAGGAEVVVDGDAGAVELAPLPERVEQAREAMRTAGVRTIEGGGRTADGEAVVLAANAGSVDQARIAADAGADEIGLFRTEFLFFEHGGLPSEDEQTAVYRGAVEAMAGRRVTFRTLDVGGDKPLPALPMPAEANPMLGNRGIRLWSANNEVSTTQLRALLRASAAGPIGIMFPMVTRCEEFDAAAAAVDAAAAELKAEGIDVGDDVTLGVMIETPAAALTAREFAARCDFLSIGTNDLLQYLFAADRDNPAVAELLDSGHPALLRAVALVAEAAGETSTTVAVCGESAADPDVQLAFVGLGVGELSMVAGNLAGTQANLAEHTLAELQDLARRAVSAATAQEARAVLRGDPAPAPAQSTPAPEQREDGSWTVEVVVASAEGLHARPAAELVDLASQFTCDVTLHTGGLTADAKSMLAVLSLGADQGASVRVETAGADAEDAANAVAAALTKPT